jgi:hypothetical protein
MKAVNFQNVCRSAVVVGAVWSLFSGTSVGAQALPPEFSRYSREGKPKVEGEIGQITAISQLSDVKPTDWAFTALQSLVERYNCIAGYPDRSFRGQQALTRYEFATGLNACLDKISEIIASGLADKVSKDDLAAIQKLQEEFAAELATLRGRVDTLEGKVATLESQQFSTTTKLEGQVIFAVTGNTTGGANLLDSNNGILNAGATNVTAIARARLNLNTSFTGDDLLLTRLEAGNNGTGVGNLFDAGIFQEFTGFANSTALDYSGTATTFGLARLRYDFPIGKDIRVTIGPVVGLNDHLDANSYANDESVDFSSRLFINNPLILPVNTGAGGVVDWNPSGGAFSLRLGYVAANGSATIGDGTINQGLFGDPYQLTGELEYAVKQGEEDKIFALKLQYTRASVNNLDYNTGGVNLEWLFAKNAAFFARYGFGNLDNRRTTISTALPTYVNPAFLGSSLSPQTWSLGFAFANLFKPDATGAIAIGQPFIESNVGNATQTNVELFYNFPVSDNIRITPDVQFIFNANNNSANGTIVVGTLRTVFTF